MRIDSGRYQKMVQEAAPKTKCARNSLFAFLFGGALCILGQGVFDAAAALGAEKDAAAGYSSLALIFLAAILTACNVFDKIGKIAGAGTLVPITGFANAVVSAGMEFRTEGLITGTATKFFTIAGPVVVYGVVFSFLYGIILAVLKLF